MTTAATKRAELESRPHRPRNPAGLLQFHPLAEPPAMRFFPLVEGRLTLGRSSDCTIQLEDDEVSRHHATIEEHGDGWRVLDEGSSNGLYVAGERQQRALLSGGEILRLGSTLFRLYPPGDSPAAVACELAVRQSTMVGGPKVDELRRIIKRFAGNDLPVLISGETGTGKEVAAQLLHQASSRRRRPFVGVNCAALPEQIFESQLFGHARGAFTGASGESSGLFRSASGGTLFLDEIGEIPLALQPKLLRALQERCVLPLGASRPVPVDIRIVCATNQDLQEQIRSGTFRQDLFARVAGLELTLPPLRRRLEDIPLLVHHFVRKHGDPRPGISVLALEHLCCQRWPRNIRELEMTIQRALVFTGDEPDIQLGHVCAASPSNAPEVQAPSSTSSEQAPAEPRPPSDPDPRALQVHRALIEARGNARLAAQIMGVSRGHLYRMLKKFDLEVDRYRERARDG